MRDCSAVGATPLRGKCRVSEVAPKGGSLAAAVTPESATVPIPGDVLTMALTHLMENAAKHGAQTVQIAVDTTGMTIAGGGAGISEDNRTRGFEPFFTTRRRNGGTGMGLNIIHSAIEATGGAITLVLSETGTRFRIVFTR